MKATRAFLYVQHLLGIGHLRRTAHIANALASHGMDVTLVSGGFPVEGLRLKGVRLVQLPPAGAADESFRQLVAADGKVVDDEWKTVRRRQLVDAWERADPHLVLIELFPFGRRQLRFELIPLLDSVLAARRRALVVCSVRDVLGGGQKNPVRQDEMLATFEHYFDRLLVHGDPAVLPFERTFRHAGMLRPKLNYTGYVVPPSPPAPSGERGGNGAGEVIVSAGGGAVGMRLLETALRARPKTRLSDARWRILAGVNAAPDALGTLQTLARVQGDDVVIERSRPDFSELLANCAVSVSQAGYNTMLELVSAGARSVVVPYAGGNETEQSVRAHAFAERGLTHALAESDLTPESLAHAIDSASARPRPSADVIDMGGTRRTSELLAGWTKEFRC